LSYLILHFGNDVAEVFCHIFAGLSLTFEGAGEIQKLARKKTVVLLMQIAVFIKVAGAEIVIAEENPHSWSLLTTLNLDKNFSFTSKTAEHWDT